MKYHYSKKLRSSFDEVVDQLIRNLQSQGFGIITNTDMKGILKQKKNIDFRNYKILGACNPEFAYKAMNIEPHVGVMLPCNVVVQEHDNGEVEVSAINPMETIDKIGVTELNDIAREVSNRLKVAVDAL